MSDGEEVQAGTSPSNNDSDFDGLRDGDERRLATNPLKADTDSDGVVDGLEVYLGIDPLNSDSDGDGINDGTEVNLGTNPLKSDSDGDTLSDSAEIQLGTNPLKGDSDGDGISDSIEISLGLNPMAPDSDGDGLIDGVELQIGTDAKLADTDGDTLQDGLEVQLGLNPLIGDYVGRAVTVYCQNAIRISAHDAYDHVWFATESPGFVGWDLGHTIIENGNALVNIATQQSRKAAYLGEFREVSGFTISPAHDVIQLNGSTWQILTAFQVEASDWNGMTESVVRSTLFIGGQLEYFLVNQERCEVIQVVPY